MLATVATFLVALVVLLVSANRFTRAAEHIGQWIGLSGFVVGVFIVGIGTSLPELVSAVVSVRAGVSEIVAGNVFGANISNLLLITGTVAVLTRSEVRLGSGYILIDQHYLLGSFFLLWLIARDAEIVPLEALFGLLVFIVYSSYLIKQGGDGTKGGAKARRSGDPPLRHFAVLALTAAGIYFGADFTVSALTDLSKSLALPPSFIALTVLSLGTTLPELVVNVTAIRQGKAEMAVGNVLGSCVFNALIVPGVASLFGVVSIPPALLSLSLPVMLGAALFFYLLTLDKRISKWEGWLFILLYGLFLQQLAVAQ